MPELSVQLSISKAIPLALSSSFAYKVMLWLWS